MLSFVTNVQASVRVTRSPEPPQYEKYIQPVFKICWIINDALQNDLKNLKIQNSCHTDFYKILDQVGYENYLRINNNGCLYLAHPTILAISQYIFTLEQQGYWYADATLDAAMTTLILEQDFKDKVKSELNVLRKQHYKIK